MEGEQAISMRLKLAYKGKKESLGGYWQYCFAQYGCQHFQRFCKSAGLEGIDLHLVQPHRADEDGMGVSFKVLSFRRQSITSIRHTMSAPMWVLFLLLFCLLRILPLHLHTFSWSFANLKALYSYIIFTFVGYCSAFLQKTRNYRLVRRLHPIA